LILKPLFVEPLTTIQPILTLNDILESNSKLKGSSNLLLGVGKVIGDGIPKRIDVIHDIWEITHNSTIFSSRIMHFRE